MITSPNRNISNVITYLVNIYVYKLVPDLFVLFAVHPLLNTPSSQYTYVPRLLPFFSGENSFVVKLFAVETVSSVVMNIKK